MRLSELNLIKYGKFDKETLPFPAAEFDFHVIVGPNEAGKSTFRTAVSELLFGMKVINPLGYLHGTNELRIGGTLEGGPGPIEFHRARGRSGTLRTPSDDKLPEDYLVPYLAGATREFFEQMFGLDHVRLVQGGKSILDASDKIGQVLFESATGIGSLGPVRQALEAKASEIWSARNKTSEFALSESAFVQATNDLKSALVRTKEWNHRKTALDELNEEIERVLKSIRDLEFQRTKLERVRRLAPKLNGLSEKEAALAELGIVTDLPPDALIRLQTAQQEISTAKTKSGERVAELTARQDELSSLTPDQPALDLIGEIELLGGLRGSCVNHPRDLPKRQAEHKGIMREVVSAAAQLGWSVEENALRDFLPRNLSVKTLHSLLRRHGELKLSLQNAKETSEDKQRELKDAKEQLTGLAAGAIPESLGQALSEARPHKNLFVSEMAIEKEIAANKAHVESSLQALGRWRLPVEQLIKLDVPSSERILALQNEASECKSNADTAGQAVKVAKGDVERWILQVKHFEQNKRVVTGGEVLEARNHRDATWLGLKGGSVGLSEGAPSFENAVRLADELVDTKLTTTEDAAMLQSHKQNLEIARSTLAIKEKDFLEREQALSRFNSNWQALADSTGVSGMALEDMPAWVRKREAVISAQSALETKSSELERLREAAGRSREVLLKALQEIGLGRPVDALATLIDISEKLVQSIERIQTQRESLLDRIPLAERAVKMAETRTLTAHTELESWTKQWKDALAASKIDGVASDLAAAEVAIALVESIEANLKAASGPIDRIEGMQADLKNLEKRGRRLAEMLQPDLLALNDPFEIARRLNERLSAAQEAKRSIERVKGEIQLAEKKVKEVQTVIAVAESQVKPLLERAGVASLEECILISEKANKFRELNADVNKARLDLLNDVDGLTLEQISSEILENDLVQLPALLEQTMVSKSEETDKLTTLLQSQVTVKQEFDAINGQANAAIAESKRHEALAAIGEAAEHYVELTTAHRLLKWAIDRYRDQKQGPMLRRASEIFSGLTLGEFTKLVVDSEKSPPELSAKRGNGRQVEILGLSEGTRDQLFLALRIAALELQISSKIALPFIADDLFINFDDERAKAGFSALKELSKKTQVLFLTHHDHLLPIVREVFGENVNVIELKRAEDRIASR